MVSMKARTWLVIVLALSGALMSGAASADTRWRLGVYMGPGLLYYPSPWHYFPPYPSYPPYYPYSYYPPAPPAPTVYIERSAPPPPPPAEYWWNYCPESKAYYPYVRECPGGWQRVSPVPPDLKLR
jgi:hypothetical protein